MERLKLAILISGKGSNLNSIFELCEQNKNLLEISVVISNLPNVLGIKKAKEKGLKTEIVNHINFNDKKLFEIELDSKIRLHNANFICNAGFMRVLTPWFVKRWYDKQLNIHPSLLPAYPGLNTHERAITDGVKFAGCSVHYVRSELDSGPILIQAIVPVNINDTPETLAEKVLMAENKIYPQAIKWVAEGKVRIVNKKVEISKTKQSRITLFNPELEN